MLRFNFERVLLKAMLWTIRLSGLTPHIWFSIIAINNQDFINAVEGFGIDTKTRSSLASNLAKSRLARGEFKNKSFWNDKTDLN
jgi:hypothetical protein